MSIRCIALGAALIVACGSKPEPRAPESAIAAAPPPSEPAPPPEPAPAAEPEPASTQRSPPQTWELYGTRNDGQKVKMGVIVWRGGEDVVVNMMGTMKMMMEQQIGEAIKDKPDDPDAAIQGVIDMANESGRPMFEWVRAEAK